MSTVRRMSMNGVWIAFSVCCLVVAEGLFGQRRASPVELTIHRNKSPVAKTKFPLFFKKGLIKRLIESNGYGYENYTITTEDGYLLNLNRIIHPNRTGSDRGYPLLLVNGYFMQSEAWLVQPKLDSNLGFMFANEGYDVWLGDQRGTMRSKGHVNLTADDPRLYDYTFHETGLYDIPAFTDFILRKTGQKDVIFACMSLGCSFHAVMASKRSSYNEKIRAAMYFVPLVNNIRKISTMNSVIHMWFRLQPLLVEILEKNGQYDWLPNLAKMKKEIYYLCNPTGSFPVLASKAIFGTSFHTPQEALCYIGASSLGGANSKSSRHVLQVYATGDFAEFDYGREENKKRYGTEWPPLYDMKKITTPIALYYSDSDVFASPKGVDKTAESLGGPTYKCQLPNFNHLDVASGSTFRFVLPDVIQLLNSLSGYSNDTKKFKSGKCPSMEWIRHLQ